MFRFETSVVVDRPIDEVWAFLMDPFELPRYGEMTLGIRKTSQGPIGIGSTFQGRATILGFETRGRATLTEWDPPHAFAFSIVALGARSVGARVALEAAAQGIKVVRVVELEPRVAFKPLWWIIWPYVTRRSQISDQNLKRLLEAGRG